jgi:hypothetical protein
VIDVGRLNLTPEIREVARQLGVPLSGGGELSNRITNACAAIVERWCRELGPVETFDDLLEVAAAKLKVRFEEIRSDEGLQEVAKRYAAQGELGFVDLEREFDSHTDAAVVRLQKVPPWSDTQYVAVIDARAHKVWRSWFSKWHELAHLIAEPQTKFIFRRTQETRQNSLERLMDQIAAELAFYRPLLLPLLERSAMDLGAPSLSEMLAFIEDNLSFASRQSALIALLRHVPVPAILVEAKDALKPRERGQLALLEECEPVPRLRAVTVFHNEPAIRGRFYIHRWMQVPADSVIRAVYGDEAGAGASSTEDLSWWESEGRTLGTHAVRVEAVRMGDRVLALVSDAANDAEM